MARKRIKSERIVFEFQAARSRAARKGWETQWNEGKRIGKKGADYIEAKYERFDIEAPIIEYGEEYDT